MNHLLLDTAKLQTKTADIPFKHARVGILATFKQAKKLITPDEPHAIYVLPEKNAAAAIIQAAAEILQHQPSARLAIVSPREKITAAAEALRLQYPQASIVHKKRLGKKVRLFLKQQPENTHSEPTALSQTATAATEPDAEAELIRNAALLIHAAAKQTQKTDTAVSQTDNPTSDTEPDIAAALLLLKKNRPKKKTDLVRLLAQSPHIAVDQAHALIGKLENENIIRIDAAENVKYQQ